MLMLYINEFTCTSCKADRWNKNSKADTSGQWNVAYASLDPDYFGGTTAENWDKHAVANMGGYIRVVLKKRGTTGDRITDVLVNGISLSKAIRGRIIIQEAPHYMVYSIHFAKEGAPKELIEAGEPLWFRILPEKLGWGGRWTEILVRLKHWPKDKLILKLPTAYGHHLRIPIRVSNISKRSAILSSGRIGLVTVNDTRDTVFGYVLFETETKKSKAELTSVKLDGQDVTAKIFKVNGFSKFGMIPFSVKLEKPWNEGTYHLLECRLSTKKKLICSVRANNGFSVMMFGANFEEIGVERAFRDFREHYIDTWNVCSGRDAWAAINKHDFQIMARKYGIRLQPNFHDAQLRFEDIASLGKADGYIQSYWLFDEPEVNDALTGKKLNIPHSQRLGMYSQRLMTVAEAIRQSDPVHPTCINIAKSFYPRGYYTYGQLSDIMTANIYYPVSGNMKWDPVPYMYNGCRSARRGFMPKPMTIIVNASPRTKNVGEVLRAPTAEEERISVYCSLAAGANAIAYYWYNANKIAGCQWIPDTWVEIATLNRQLQLLRGKIGIAFPIELPVIAPKKIWVKTVSSGPDTLIAIIVNTDYSSSREGFKYTPMEKTPITLMLPQGLEINSVTAIEDDGPVSVTFIKEGSKVVFDTGRLEIGRIVLLSSDGDLYERIRQRWFETER
jgi:hypothetical protein